MPELPEVNSIKLQLQKFLIGSPDGGVNHRIEKVEVKFPKIFEGNSKAIEGSTVKDVRRFAKVLSIDLSNGKSLVIHIKLTGQLIYRGPNLANPAALSKKVAGGVPGPHTHVIFHLDRGGVLYYNDVRRFGWIRVFDTDKVEKEGFVEKLGPEPFGNVGSKPEILTFEYFQKVLSKTARAIKVVLMDQSKIGGVGNIYASDALWLAKINPRTPAKNLSSEKARELYDAIHTVLKAGIKYGGASELAFVTPDGQEGKYQEHTLVYGRTGKQCLRCNKEPARSAFSTPASNASHSNAGWADAGGKIQKYFLAGRGTYVCPVCQK